MRPEGSEGRTTGCSAVARIAAPLTPKTMQTKAAKRIDAGLLAAPAG